MKKFLMIICVALMSVSAFAQKGSVWAGGDVRYCMDKDYKNVGVDAKLQWQALNFLRFEGVVGYMFEKNDYSRLDAQINTHLLINLGKDGMNIYPIGGFIFGHEMFNVDHNATGGWVDTDETNDAVDLILGGGFEFPINDRMKFNVEYKYLYLDTSEISIGIAVRI